MAWILTVSCVCWSTRAWLARSLGWREPRSKSSGRCVDTMDSDTLFAVSKEFTDLNVWVMYTMHSHSTLCRCQFFSCNTNTLLEITGLSPAGGIQTAYNLSIVNLLFCIICLNVVYPGILDVPRRLENTPKMTLFWFNVWNAVLKAFFFPVSLMCTSVLHAFRTQRPASSCFRSVVLSQQTGWCWSVVKWSGWWSVSRLCWSSSLM